jgi:hypothetical protein
MWHAGVMNVCPRCLHAIPNDEHPGAYPGALSRSDNRTVICSLCGSLEALMAMTGQDLSQETWPVEVPAEIRAQFQTNG